MLYLICKNAHRYDPFFNALQDNQGSTGRHKCAGCAYELGRMQALIGIPKAHNDSVLGSLPDSQAGSVRHKDAFQAYLLGYDEVVSSVMLRSA